MPACRFGVLARQVGADGSELSLRRLDRDAGLEPRRRAEPVLRRARGPGRAAPARGRAGTRSRRRPSARRSRAAARRRSRATGRRCERCPIARAVAAEHPLPGAVAQHDDVRRVRSSRPRRENVRPRRAARRASGRSPRSTQRGADDARRRRRATYVTSPTCRDRTAPTLENERWRCGDVDHRAGAQRTTARSSRPPCARRRARAGPRRRTAARRAAPTSRRRTRRRWRRCRARA